MTKYTLHQKAAGHSYRALYAYQGEVCWKSTGTNKRNVAVARAKEMQPAVLAELAERAELKKQDGVHSSPASSAGANPPLLILAVSSPKESFSEKTGIPITAPESATN